MNLLLKVLILASAINVYGKASSFSDIKSKISTFYRDNQTAILSAAAALCMGIAIGFLYERYSKQISAVAQFEESCRKHGVYIGDKIQTELAKTHKKTDRFANDRTSFKSDRDIGFFTDSLTYIATKQCTSHVYSSVSDNAIADSSSDNNPAIISSDYSTIFSNSLSNYMTARYTANYNNVIKIDDYHYTHILNNTGLNPNDIDHWYDSGLYMTKDRLYDEMRDKALRIDFFCNENVSKMTILLNTSIFPEYQERQYNLKKLFENLIRVAIYNAKRVMQEFGHEKAKELDVFFYYNDKDTISNEIYHHIESINHISHLGLNISYNIFTR